MGKSILKIILACVALSSCSSLLYFPSGARYINEKNLPIAPEEIFLKSSEDKQLMSWFFKSSNTKKSQVTIIFSHGNGQNMSAHFRSLYWLLDLGINYLIVEYPGYGPNDGTPSPRSTIESVTLAMDWTRKNRPEDKILLFGQSLGGNVMLRALSEYSEKKSFCAVAIESSFASYKEVAQSILAKKWFLWPFQWLPYLLLSDSRAIVSNFKELPDLPYFIIHGDRDKIVPFSLGKKLYKKLPANKSFLKVDGGRHIDTFYKHQEHRKDFLDFISKNCHLAD